MTELAIALSAEEVYEIDLNNSEAPKFITHIIDAPHNLVTYNWKEQIRAMLWWLQN